MHRWVTSMRHITSVTGGGEGFFKGRYWAHVTWVLWVKMRNSANRDYSSEKWRAAWNSKSIKKCNWTNFLGDWKLWQNIKSWSWISTAMDWWTYVKNRLFSRNSCETNRTLIVYNPNSNHKTTKKRTSFILVPKVRARRHQWRSGFNQTPDAISND